MRGDRVSIREHCLTSTSYRRVSNVAFGALERLIRIPGHQRVLCPGDKNAWNSAVLSSQSPVPAVRLLKMSFWRPPKVCTDSQSSISRSLFTCGVLEDSCSQPGGMLTVSTDMQLSHTFSHCSDFVAYFVDVFSHCHR